MDKCVIRENDDFKAAISENYNYVFSKTDGTFYRWGKEKNIDPAFSPYGPELLDLEISANGCPNNCRFCYKGNTNAPATNMTLETFKKIFHTFPKTLTQIAFGITGVQTNKDFIPMMEYARGFGIIPNFTLTGIDLTDELAERISKVVGALAVSLYADSKNIGYKTVRKFVSLGVKQTNVHLMVSEQTIDWIYRVLKDYLAKDYDIKDVNAFVFLGVKPKGRAKNSFTPLNHEKFKALVDFCFDNKIPFGFDSCSAPKFEKVVREANISEEKRTEYLSMSESCESGLFSAYINCEGKFFPCSFTEDVEEGIDVLQHNSFLDIWNSDKVKTWRDNLISSSIGGTRYCPAFPEIYTY